ncbi:Hypothetical protein R9X50_00249900 [Acrodontium crateriforme]|uniref:Trafficking protein particle complex II-specific subunit 65 IgD3 domain-containing protein n=1 Tax=Acrodontium crateriforme TaxID=150365 RepID=A0AAQ3M4D9_9PEZI|nr:Hypothetical protein R9X50_00249900 [Acrodontium crateriforme]
MASEGGASLKRRFDILSKDAVLDVSLPKTSESEIDAILNDSSASIAELAGLPSRRNVFLDENATVLLVLKTHVDENHVRDLLPDLEVGVAAYATDAVPQASGTTASASGKYDVTSKTFNAETGVKISAGKDFTLLVWKLKLHLSRPRARLQRPAVYFAANITVSSSSFEPARQVKQRYLQSYESIPGNVLAPLKFDPSLVGSNIQLSEDRITKIAPTESRAEYTVKPLRATATRAFPAVPALFTKVRYSSLPGSTIASLYIETSHAIEDHLSLKNVELKLSGGFATRIDGSLQTENTSPGDETVLTYKLQSNSIQSTGQDLQLLKFAITAAAYVDAENSIDLEIGWQSQVDLSQTHSKPLYRWSRPLSISSIHQARLTAQNARPPSFEDSHKAISQPKGLVFTFTGPETVHQHDDFQLHVQCVNRSHRARRFALVVVPSQKSRTQFSVSQRQSNEEDGKQTADFITGLLKTSSVELQKPPDVLDYNPDVRIGPLPPSASYDLRLRFRALTTGVLDLGIVRIVDLDTRQTIDVKELPDVISCKGDAGGL